MQKFLCGNLQMAVRTLRIESSVGLVQQISDAVGSFEEADIELDDVMLVMHPRVAREVVRNVALNYSDPSSKQDWMWQWKIFPMLGAVVPFRTLLGIPGAVDRENRLQYVREGSEVYLVGFRV